MNVNLEEKFVNNFINASYRERLLFELKTHKKRLKALMRFSHDIDKLVKVGSIISKSKIFDEKELKQFLIDNWKEIATALLFLLSVIAAFIRGRKKGYSFSDVLLGLISEHLPEWINKAEDEGGTGDQKKVTVLNSVLNFASKTLGRKLSEEETSFLVTKASELIEQVLGTPQKKEGEKKMEVKKNGAKYR